MLQLAKESLELAQERMKAYANKGRTDRHFEVVDWVYLRLQHYRQSLVVLRKNLKLAARYFGHF